MMNISGDSQCSKEAFMLNLNNKPKIRPFYDESVIIGRSAEALGIPDLATRLADLNISFYTYNPLSPDLDYLLNSVGIRRRKNRRGVRLCLMSMQLHFGIYVVESEYYDAARGANDYDGFSCRLAVKALTQRFSGMPTKIMELP